MGVLIVVNRLGLGKKIDDPLACRSVLVASSSRFFPALATLAVSGSAGYPLRRLRKLFKRPKPKRPKNTGSSVALNFVFFGLPAGGQSGKSAVASFALASNYFGASIGQINRQRLAAVAKGARWRG